MIIISVKVLPPRSYRWFPQFYLTLVGLLVWAMEMVLGLQILEEVIYEPTESRPAGSIFSSSHGVYRCRLLSSQITNDRDNLEAIEIIKSRPFFSSEGGFQYRWIRGCHRTMHGVWLQRTVRRVLFLSRPERSYPSDRVCGWLHSKYKGFMVSVCSYNEQHNIKLGMVIMWLIWQ